METGLLPAARFPTVVFFQRSFLNVWAGLIGSAIGAFYAFLRYAKLYEHYRFEGPWTSRLPAGAPIVRAERDEAGRIVKAVESGNGVS